MKMVSLLHLCICFYGNAFSQGTITLQVEGIDLKKGGQLSIAIFDETNFLKTGKQLRALEVEVISEKMEISFEKIAMGTYAVAVFQDTDWNHELKTNFVGFPQERIGFSKDAHIKFGPPSFSDAQFKLEKEDIVVLKIILR